jgi:hypothetical protein
MGQFTNKLSELENQPPGLAQTRQEIPISGELMARYEDSVRRYPRIHLTKGEYVVMEVRRHPIGILSIWGLTVVMVLIALAIIPFYSATKEQIADTFSVGISSMPTVAAVALPSIALAAVFVVGGVVAAYVYNGNLFYLTNESIMQFEQNSIFSTKEQQINLVNVDDVSYRQQGVLQHMLNYGTIRVSTEGDERNPYIFYFVARPQLVVRTINDAMEDATGFAVRYRQYKNADTSLPPPDQF